MGAAVPSTPRCQVLFLIMVIRFSDGYAVTRMSPFAPSSSARIIRLRANCIASFGPMVIPIDEGSFGDAALIFTPEGTLIFAAEIVAPLLLMARSSPRRGILANSGH